MHCGVKLCCAVLASAAASLVIGGCSRSSSTGPGGGAVGGVVTVTGTVVLPGGGGVPGIPVLVGGRTPTNTDASGNFTVAGVSVPYDVTLVDAAAKTGLVYKGLSRTDPMLVLLTSGPPVNHSAYINGKVSGGTFAPNQGESDVTQVVFASPEALLDRATSADGTFGPMHLIWGGPATTTGTLYSLQYTPGADGFPAAAGYRGYGVLPGVAVGDGATLNDQFDTLQSVMTTQFTATLTIPAGYGLSTNILLVQLTPFAAFQIAIDNSQHTAISYYTPDIPGATLMLGTLISGNAGASTLSWKSGLPTGAAGVSIEIAAPPNLTLPVDGATAVDTSVTFSWIPMAGAVHILSFSSPASATPSFIVVTAGTSGSVPNLSSLGLGLPSATRYYWNVYGYGPFTGIDDAAGSSRLGYAMNLPLGAAGNVFAGHSPPRRFTTAP